MRGWKIFEDQADYEAFEHILAQAVERTETRLLAYCVMPNHWHLVVWPREDGELSRFVGWLTLTHTQRWHAHRPSTGSGHLYLPRDGVQVFVVLHGERFEAALMWSGTRSGQGWCGERSSGDSAVCSAGCAAPQRTRHYWRPGRARASRIG